MNKLLLISAILVSLCTSELLVVKDFTISKSSNIPFVQTFQKPEWNEVKEFAVYGWIRSSQAISSEIQVIRLSSNQGPNTNSIGDQVLRVHALNKGLYFGSYDTTKNNPKIVEDFKYTFEPSTWTFFYTGYNPEEQQIFNLVKKVSDDSEIVSGISELTHNKSNFYQLIIGNDNGIKNNDVIEIKSLWINVGKGAFQSFFDYKSDLYQSPHLKPNPILPTPVNPDVPNPLPKCCAVYSECNFQGVITLYCENDPQVKKPVFKSVYILPNKTLTIFDSQNYQGKTVKFNKSVNCLNYITYTMLIKTGDVEIIENQKPSLSLKRQN